MGRPRYSRVDILIEPKRLIRGPHSQKLPKDGKMKDKWFDVAYLIALLVFKAVNFAHLEWRK
jgi:hypothetical protein